MNTAYYFLMPVIYHAGNKNIPGILYLSHGALSFSSKDGTVVCGDVKDLHIHLTDSALTITSSQTTYNFEKVSIGYELTQQLMNALPPTNEDERKATEQLIEQTNKQDLLIAYQDGKYTNEMWMLVLNASGAHVEFSANQEQPRSRIRLPFIIIGAVVLILLVIAFRIFSTHS